jgi:hypothetical protein
MIITHLVVPRFNTTFPELTEIRIFPSVLGFSKIYILINISANEKASATVINWKIESDVGITIQFTADSIIFNGI